MLYLQLRNHKRIPPIWIPLENEGEFFRLVNQVDKRISGIFTASLYIGNILCVSRPIGKPPARVYYAKTNSFMPFSHFLKHFKDYSYTQRYLLAQYINDPEIIYSKYYR